MLARRSRHELAVGDVSRQCQGLGSQTDLRRLWSELDLQVEAKLVARRWAEQSQLCPGRLVSCLCRYGLKSDTARLARLSALRSAWMLQGLWGMRALCSSHSSTARRLLCRRSSPLPEEPSGRFVVPPDGGQVICSVSCCADTQEERGSSSVVLFVLIRIRH